MKNESQVKKKQYVDVELVKALMKARGIDAKTMASRMQSTLSTLEKILSGADQKKLKGDIPCKIAYVLSVPVELIIHKDYH